MEARLAEVTQAMGDSLNASALRTARSLGELQQRLETIDKAQTNIEKLSGDVLGLQDILSNKQTRGAFGEIQLREIVTRALPPDVVTFQATLSNGIRADCLIDLPQPPGPIVIDAKFPLEAYEALRAAKTPAEVQAAQRQMRGAVRAHMRAIAEKYVIEGETAEGALMFLPSEAVYAELHAELRRPGARGLRAAGLDRVAHDLHGDAPHPARGAEGRAAAGRGARDPARARAAPQATSSGCRSGSATSTATSGRRRRTSRRSGSPPTGRSGRARRLEAIDFATESEREAEPSCHAGSGPAECPPPSVALESPSPDVAGCAPEPARSPPMAQLALDDHPDRYALVNELHARPFPELTAPCRAVHLAIKQPGDAADRDRRPTGRT